MLATLQDFSLSANVGDKQVWSLRVVSHASLFLMTSLVILVVFLFTIIKNLESCCALGSVMTNNTFPKRRPIRSVLKIGRLGGA